MHVTFIADYFLALTILYKSVHSLVGVQFPRRGNDGILFLCHCVQTGFGVQSASYLVVTGAFTLGVKLSIYFHLVPRLRLC
jgi:hypothetical protein